MLEVNTTDTDPGEGSSGDDSTMEESTTSKTAEISRRQPYRFKDSDDISILQEVLVEKPTGKDGTKKWKAIFERLGLPVKDYVAIKRRFKDLLAKFKAKNLKSLRGSGLEENYDEKLRLLTDIVSQMEDWEQDQDQVAVTKKRKLDESQRRGQLIREAAMANMKDADVDSELEGATETTPTRPKRLKPADVLGVLKQSEEKDRSHLEAIADLKKKKLEIMEKELCLKTENDQHRREMEARRLRLDEERMEMEKKRLENDSEERKLFMQLLSKNLK